MTYTISLNKYDGLLWTAQSLDLTNYDSLCKFITKLQTIKYKYIVRKILGKYNGYNKYLSATDLSNLTVICSCKGQKYFDMLKSFVCCGEENIDITSLNSYDRIIIYAICNIFGLSYDTIKTTEKIYIPCTSFLKCNKGIPENLHIKKIYDENQDDIVCGCDYAPRWFHKNHSHNNYDDDISYSFTYRTCKTGVRIFKSYKCIDSRFPSDVSGCILSFIR